MISMKTVYQVGQVLSVNIASIWVFLTDVNIILAVLCGASALSFTLYKFYKEIKKNS